MFEVLFQDEKLALVKVSQEIMLARRLRVWPGYYMKLKEIGNHGRWYNLYEHGAQLVKTTASNRIKYLNDLLLNFEK